MPSPGDLDGQNTRGQLSRVNFMREEPAGAGSSSTISMVRLYILDKQTKQFTTYLDFNGAGDAPGSSSASVRTQFRDRAHDLPVRSGLRA